MWGGIIKYLDPTRFEPVLFCHKQAVHYCRENIGRADLTIQPLEEEFASSVVMIRSYACHVMYHWKVGGSPRDYFFPFARLAPIQCTCVGTHGTSGVKAVDWYLSSQELESHEASSRHYTEQLYRGQAFPCYMSRMSTTQSFSREELGIPKTSILYFCPHRLPKYHPMFDEYLKRILQETQGYLLMLAAPETENGQKLQRRLKQHLGDALYSRVIPRPYQTPEKLYAMLAEADAMLDPPTYTSGIGAYDAFSSSTPIVTERGDIAVRHQMAGLYDRMQMHHFPACNQDEYVEKAVRLGTEPEYRKEISNGIANAATKIFDDLQAVTDFEDFCTHQGENP
jgi:predicted O-linked N-acetylglucosamine transferase (SPINDLY family)